MLSLKAAFIYTIFISLITFFTRIFSFVVFKKLNSSNSISIIEKYIPPAVMMLLLIYCLKNIDFTIEPHGVPEILGVFTAIIFQYKFKNPLIAIFGATGLYMFLIRII